ncbi:SDR family NAD(P)-dependent oxidoreductase [Trebonia sp.]|uniref:SDR family NAD(P)-dependent oxidoreductase n=1 Tax=Trebonia sp. TaxID=2767075 RepID=UPI00260DB4F5|nr:SDR family NAD(P)-dependent oxidoreductase [Trebonia sp.]
MGASEPDLTGKRVIVTGGASGMGRGIVSGLSARGASVVSFDLNAEAGKDAADTAGARFVQVDVTDQASIDAAFAAAAEHLGGLDVLVHAAGVAPGAPAEQTDLDTWDTCIAVNATGTFLTNVAAWRLMHEHGGKIIDFASGAGITGLPGKSAYAAAKGAVVAWVRSIAVEWAKHGITVNAIAPSIWTPMYDRTRASMTPEQLAAHDADLAARILIGGKLGDVDSDLVPVIAFLVSDNSRFITGQILPVDGGLLMMR